MNGFCGPPKIYPGLNDGPLPIVRLEFQAQNYDDHLFQAFGITLPDRVRKSVQARRADYLAGRVCAQAALTLIQKGTESVATGLGGEPLWPEGVVGSVSHSVSLAAASVTADAHVFAIGLDIQAPASRSAKISLCNIASIRADLGRISLPLNSEIKPILPELLFSARESFFKAFYPVKKLRIGYEAVELVRLDIETRKISVSLTQDYGAPFEKGTVWDVDFAVLENGSVLTRAIFCQA